MRAVIYTRVSSDPKQQSQSVKSQEEECRKECERNGWTVERVFCDNDISASRHSKKERPEHAKLLAYLANGKADVLVMWASSRVQRGLEAYVDLRAICAAQDVLLSYKGKLIDLNTAAGRFDSGLDALLDERDSEVIREAVQRGVNAHVAAGKPYGKVPYGYYREYDGKRALIGQFIKEDEAKIIRECAERFLSGEAPHAIARDLNARGVPSPGRGKDGWTLSQIRVMLTKPTYIAKRTHHGMIVTDGDWPAILDKDVFDQCVRKFDDPSRRSTTNRATKYLLTGIAKCGVCGAVLKAMPNRKNMSYQCKAKWCVTRKLKETDELVVATVLARLSRTDFLDFLRRSSRPDVNHALERYNTLDAEMRDLDVQAATTDIPVTILTARYNKLAEEMKQLEPLITTTEAPTVLMELAKKPHEMWEELTIEQKREVIRFICEVTLLKVGRGKRNFDPASVRIEFASQTPELASQAV